jgi:hypothetical protein
VLTIKDEALKLLTVPVQFRMKLSSSSIAATGIGAPKYCPNRLDRAYTHSLAASAELPSTIFEQSTENDTMVVRVRLR